MLALTNIATGGLTRFSQGKVRDVFDLGDVLLIVASDRLSAFDVVLPTGIPAKGHVLNQLSAFWFEYLMTPHHMIAWHWASVWDAIRRAGGTPDESLAGRSMVVRKTAPVPLECVVRGYIAGSLWKEYRASGGPDRAVELHGLSLPAGVRESERLPHPIFTPSTKATAGHDENISVAQAASVVGEELVRELERRSVDLYARADDYARTKGLILADTKFEFGMDGGELILIDEALTPDSSRYWDMATYSPGGAQPSYDKQFVRDYLETLAWDKTPPGPSLPPDVVEGTSSRYREAFRLLTGRELEHTS